VSDDDTTLIQSEAAPVPLEPLYTCVDTALVPWPTQTTHLCHIVICRPQPQLRGEELVQARVAASAINAMTVRGSAAAQEPRVVMLPAANRCPPLKWRVVQCERAAAATAAAATATRTDPGEHEIASSTPSSLQQILPAWFCSASGYGPHLSLSWRPPVLLELVTCIPSTSSQRSEESWCAAAVPVTVIEGADSKPAAAAVTAGSAEPQLPLPEKQQPEDSDEPWVVLTAHCDLQPRQIASLVKVLTVWIVLRLVEALDAHASTAAAASSTTAEATTAATAAATLGLPTGLNTRVLVSRRAAGLSGTSARLEANEALTVFDLCIGAMLPSGNDAATALAEHFG
jgi:hypothetical protein